MTTSKPSDSLDKWRDYFQRGDSDIFEIIDHAIMVAAADMPNEFKTKRDKIAELLFSSCKVSHCIGCDHLDKDDTVVATEDEKKPNKNQIVNNHHTYGDAEFKALSDQLRVEASVNLDEILRIKPILLNKDNEPNSVLLESLRKLETMPMKVEILKDTGIGKAVTSLRKHSSDEIRTLARTLFTKWKEMVDQWMKNPKEMARGTERTPESANISIVDQAYAFPSPPHDLDIFAPHSSDFELSKILDCLDSDGNPLQSSVEAKPERKIQTSERRRPKETNVVERYTKDQKMKKSATDFDEPRSSKPKQSREQMVPSSQRKPPLVTSEQKRKLAGPRQDHKLKDMEPEEKFEFAKRRLKESYKEHDNAKRQRKIQVLETIPNQSKTQKPQVKRSVRR